jgi:hypothetical protein
MAGNLAADEDEFKLHVDKVRYSDVGEMSIMRNLRILLTENFVLIVSGVQLLV